MRARALSLSLSLFLERDQIGAIADENVILRLRDARINIEACREQNFT